MQTIPLIAVPAQSLSVVLAGQACTVNLYSLQTPGDILAPGSSPLLDSYGNPVLDSNGHTVMVNHAGPTTTMALQGYAALHCDVLLAGTPILSGRLVRNLIPWMLSAKYQGFVGDFAMVDTLSDTDPVWTGLGAQYQLVYLEASDLALSVAA